MKFAAIEHELALAKQRLKIKKTIIDGLDVMVAVVGKDYQYQLANQAFLSSMGLEREGFEKAIPGSLHQTFFQNMAKEEIEQCFSGKIVKQELRYDFPHLGWRDLFVTYLPIDGPEGIDRIACILQDITEARRSTKALQNSEMRLGGILDEVFEFIGMFSTEGIVLEANRSLLQTVEVDRNEVIGRPFSEMYWWADSPDMQKRVRTAIGRAAQGETVHEVLTLKMFKRPKVIIKVNFVPLYNADGIITEIVGSALDITDQHELENMRLESDLRFRQLVENIQEVFWMSDIEKNQMLYISPAYEKIWGRTCESLYANPKDWYNSILPTDRERVTKAYENQSEQQPYNVEFTIVRPDGTLRNIHARAFPVRNAQGEVYRFTGIAEDISDTKLRQADLQLLQRAILAVSQGILITDARLPDNPIIYTSPSFERMTGYSAPEILGKNCRFLQGDDTDPKAVAQLRKAVTEGQDCQVELLNYRKDGTRFWNEVTISPIFGPDKTISHFVGVQTDVTQRRILEEQLRQSQKMEAVGRLAGGIAHDFNNLLTVILGYTDLIIKAVPAESKAQGMLEIIKEAGEQSIMITGQLLAFSRKQIISPKVINLNDTVIKVEKILYRLIGEDIELLSVSNPELGSVNVDAGQIEQVLFNLAVNARDAMPQGGKLTIETQNVELDASYAALHEGFRPGQYVMLAVTDSGIGMTEEIRQHIFEPFFTTKEQGQGTGLGLAVVHGIVKQSDGSIEVYSEPGRGTSFKIYLPQVTTAAGSEPPEVGVTVAEHGTETILLVEDSLRLRELTRHILEESGYTVLEAKDADEALRIAAQKSEIHLLFTDVVMPGIGGRELAEQLQATHPEMKVLFMSGYTNDAIMRHGILHEHVNFLQKPFSPLVLTQKVREVIDATIASAKRLQ